MSITQSQSPVSPQRGATEIPLQCFTIEELEALLEAAAYSLRMEQNLKHSLEDCSTHSMFDTKFLVELSFSEQSRDELLGLVGAIAHLLTEVAQ